MLNILLQSGDAVQIVLSFLAVMIAALGAIVLHENAHGLVAYWCGDPTAKMSGRLSLNPAKHFDLLGFLMFVVVGFGWAKPVPINPYNFKHQKRDTVFVSLAGIVTNLVLAFVCCGLLAALLAILQNVQTMSQGLYYFVMFVEELFLYGAIVNLSLMAFNILPIYPLDGYRVIEGLWPNSAYCRFMRKYGSYVMLGLILLSYLLGYITPNANIFSLYINAVVNGILNPMFKIFGVAF